MPIPRLLLMLSAAALSACARQDGDVPAGPEPRRFTDQVPIEFVRYAAGDGEAAWYDGLPPGFPPVDLSDGPVPLISQDGGRGQRVVFRADGDVAAARDTLAEAYLGAGGWIELPAVTTRLSRRQVFPAPLPGFSSVPSRALCHDDYGTLSILPADTDPVLTVTRNLAGPVPGGWCRAEILSRERSEAFLRGDDDIAEFLPRLEPPAGEVVPLDSGSGNGTDGWKTVVELSGAGQSLRRLGNHFARQMEDQGWDLDAQWRGRAGAGSTWVRMSDDGQRRVLGFIEIRESGNDTREIAFRLKVAAPCPAEPDTGVVLGPPPTMNCLP